ncbi:Golgi-associated RAB2B interactor protein 3-like [Dermacentor albipictus]|uniref:Golgi-associated RAB2B interactor protein 3-like n=1 Tax=Dermacentor albipictus TaxID=60249 RepID=UPI0038FCD615
MRRRLAVAEARLDGPAVATTAPGLAGRGLAAPAGGITAPSGAGGASGSAGAPAGRMDYAAALKAGIAPAAGAACGGPGGAAVASAAPGRPGAPHKHVAFLTPVGASATPARDVLRLLKTNVDPHVKDIRDVKLHSAISTVIQ